MALSESTHRRLTVRPVDRVHAADSVRHIDQLSEPARQRFYECVDANSAPVTLEATDLEPGEVIVYTDYYRVDVA